MSADCDVINPESMDRQLKDEEVWNFFALAFAQASVRGSDSERLANRSSYFADIMLRKFRNRFRGDSSTNQ